MLEDKEISKLIIIKISRDNRRRDVTFSVKTMTGIIVLCGRINDDDLRCLSLNKVIEVHKIVCVFIDFVLSLIPLYRRNIRCNGFYN